MIHSSFVNKRSLFLIALAVVFLAAHLPFVAPGPGSIDAVNFALAVRDFDLTDHRPHPPGYPVFVAMGKITKGLVSSGPADVDTVRHEGQALAIWSALFGALAVLPLFQIFRRLELDDRRAAAATALTVSCPLFWFMAIRPMSDVPGLGAALIAQALVFGAYSRQDRGEARAARRLLVVAAAASGLAIGLRSQTMWLTLPLLAVVTARQFIVNGERSMRSLLPLAGALALGVAIWAVPLVAASGGPTSYFALLGTQATQDFEDVNMLVRDPSVGRLATGLVSTFAHPWANKYVAPVVLALALIGVLAMTLRSPRALGLLALAAGPYTLFHLLYQDPVFTRYALPVVPVVAYVAVRGLSVLSERRLPWLVAALTGACIAVAGPPVIAYATTGGPVLQVTDAVRRALPAGLAERPVLAAHHEVARAIRGERLGMTQLPFPRRREWLEVVKYWREGGSSPVWFLAGSGRTDLALIDPSARRLRGEFRRPFNNRFFMSGARPDGVNWYELAAPGWMAGEGWALTPETAGVAWRYAKGPGQQPITAWVHRRPEAAVMMIGGRHLGECGQPDVRFDVSLDGRRVASWIVAPDPGFFLQTIDLPAGALHGAGRYGEVRIAAASADGVSRNVRSAIEQFDVQSADRPVFGFDRGWYALEYNLLEKRLWRWTGPWATVRVHNSGRDLTLRLAGDSPLKYVDAPPQVTVRAGAAILGRFRPSDEYDYRLKVPADALAAAGNVLTIETDRIFVPDERFHNGDGRPLGLRIFEVAVY